jgi:hypothetical protein
MYWNWSAFLTFAISFISPQDNAVKLRVAEKKM